MSLQMDINRYNIAETVINIDILRQIEDDLDLDEKISVLFLITEDYTNAFAYIFDLYQTSKTKNVRIITDYVERYSKNWKEKILEALCILNNREVIRKLGVSFDDLDIQYFPKIRLCSKNINVIAKCLYVLCESLSEIEQNILLTSVKSDIPDYEPLLDDVDYLELHILYWVQIGYITISNDKKCNLTKLLRHLKENKDLKIALIMDLEKFESHQHAIDNNTGLSNNNFVAKNEEKDLEFFKLCENQSYLSKIPQNVQTINNGLCIIINEMKFKEKYDPRHGSRADASKLSDTFKSFDFTIELFIDLNKEEILKTIKRLRKKVCSKRFDCIFLFILSHGYKGGIISSDEKEVSLEEIEKTFCCIGLEDVMKIVFVQACQGKICGSKSNHLTTDGLFDSSSSEPVDQFANFFIFMSTIQGYVSMRHERYGTWFIQEVCKVFNDRGNELTFLKCIREIMLAVKKKQGTIGNNQVAQLAEIRMDRLDSDFQLKRKTK